MPKFKVLLTDYAWPNLDIERDTLSEIDAELIVAGEKATRLDSGYKRRPILVDRNGHARQFDYDHLNRETAERWFGPNSPAQLLYIDNMSYDLGNELLTNADMNSSPTNTPISSYAYGYDGLGRLTSTDNAGTPGAPHVVLSVPSGGYDANGNRTSLLATITNGLGVAVPDFSNTYGYDAINRQTSVQQSGQAGGNLVASKLVNFTYDAAGQLATVTRYAGLAGSPGPVVAASGYTFDPDGRLTNLNHTFTTAGGTTPINYSWQFDGASRISGYTRSDGGVQSESQTYGYDPAGQLSSASGTNNESYSYDANGNRTNGNNSTPAQSDNRQSTDGTYNYSYDGEGNLTGRTAIATGDVRLFSYDYRNRLTELIDHQGSGMLLRDIAFTYDVNNLRIAKSVNGVATRYVYDGQNLVQEFNPGRSTPQEFLYGPAVDQILAANLENGAVLWALTDNLGS
ncbi:MAG: hypothetical protein HY288_12730, partial [Planctomycetia bacterium]|nr:hypothetical protein [Planctomycetia bacterium]